MRTKLQTQCTQNYKHNAHKITNTIFQPNKETKVEESALQHNNTENTEHTTVI
jgi:hypothetical protein